MKKLTLLVILLAAHFTHADTKVNEKVMKYVKVRVEDFYRDYITISEDKDQKMVAVAKKKMIKEYLTPEFASSLETPAADTDPILLQKTWGKDYVTKIKLTDFDIADKDHTMVTVTLGKHPQDEKNPGPDVLRLKLIKIKDKWKIDSIAKVESAPPVPTTPTPAPAPAH